MPRENGVSIVRAVPLNLVYSTLGAVANEAEDAGLVDDCHRLLKMLIKEQTQAARAGWMR